MELVARFVLGSSSWICMPKRVLSDMAVVEQGSECEMLGGAARGWDGSSTGRMQGSPGHAISLFWGRSLTYCCSLLFHVL